ncbi:hypothetical protein AC1031_022105 [Aphanomyces cochlioides]|nr:hypothetical protein AC1031_022105 [Aphanomyces cochlioides]
MYLPWLRIQQHRGKRSRSVIFYPNVLTSTLCPGWELLVINGRKVENMTVDDVAKVAGESKEVRITFETLLAKRFIKWKQDTGNATANKKQTSQVTNGKPEAKKHDTDEKSTTQTAQQGKTDIAHATKPKKRLISQPSTQTQSQTNGVHGNTLKKTKEANETHESTPKKTKATSDTQESTPKKAKSAPVHGTMHRYLTSAAPNIVSPDRPPQAPSPAVHHPVQELTRAEKSKMAMFIDKLTFMGFSKADAALSCEKCGVDNIDANMIWLISYIEERKFQADMNKAQIESELQKQNEDSQHKQKEAEVLQTAKSLRDLFPESVVFDPATKVPNLVHLIDFTLVNVDPSSQLRQLVIDLLKLETSARKWYKRPAECYVIKLVQRINTVLKSHAVATCCATATAADDATTPSKPCALLKLLQDEASAFKTHLYAMPSNQGGVPLAFLEADDAYHFSLADDGFEVCTIEDLVSDDDDD